MGDQTTRQDELYLRLQAEYRAPLERLARAYEADADARGDLLQEIQVALWRSLAVFDGRCSERTWVHRVAHNVGASHVIGRRRGKTLLTLEAAADAADVDDPERAIGDRQALARLTALIHQLKPPDRQLVLLYLEDLEAAQIGEITGMSPGAVATKIHRLKTLLARRFQEGGTR